MSKERLTPEEQNEIDEWFDRDACLPNQSFHLEEEEEPQPMTEPEFLLNFFEQDGRFFITETEKPPMGFRGEREND